MLDRVGGNKRSTSVCVRNESGTAIGGKKLSVIDQILQFVDGEAQKTIVAKIFIFFNSELTDTQQYAQLKIKIKIVRPMKKVLKYEA